MSGVEVLCAYQKPASHMESLLAVETRLVYPRSDRLSISCLRVQKKSLPAALFPPFPGTSSRVTGAANRRTDRVPSAGVPVSDRSADFGKRRGRCAETALRG